VESLVRLCIAPVSALALCISIYSRA
jgi:hypothetical protein